MSGRSLKTKLTTRLFCRISADIDTKDRWELYRVYDFLEQFQKPTVYETTKGYHIWIHLPKNHELTIQQIMKLREFIGDDPLRISFDMCWAGKGWRGDALFKVRRGKHHWIPRGEAYCKLR